MPDNPCQASVFISGCQEYLNRAADMYALLHYVFVVKKVGLMVKKVPKKVPRIFIPHSSLIIHNYTNWVPILKIEHFDRSLWMR